MRFAILDPRSVLNRETLREDAMAGVVLGVESVPDGLASGLLAGVNPVAGLYSYLFGTAGGALFTSSSFMAVQATGAMAIVVADVDLASHDDPARALYTLSILTGVVMVAAGLLRLGSVLRFVSESVMTGFITAVGVNIVLGQLDTFTGYDASGANRVIRALNLVANIWRIDLPTVSVGVVTMVLIVVLQRTRLGALGMVVAVVAGSALAAALQLFGSDVRLVADIADVPRSLPFLTLPAFRDMPALLLPAFSLAFVGLVQGAGVSAGFPNPDGKYPDDSQDFVGQGAGNIVAGLFQGMPVGGSMSGTSLVVAGGARSRTALLFASLVMAIVVLVLGGVVGHVAMPALAALLIVVGVGTIKPANVLSVAKTGRIQLTVLVITLVLTMAIPLQYAVLVGVAISIILFVVRQGSRLVTKQLMFENDGTWRETEPPATVPPHKVVVLQPYGSIFFAAAPILEEQMPSVTPQSANSVVILRLRGSDDAGATLIDILSRYASRLNEVGSKLVIVTDNPRIRRQIQMTGAMAAIGEGNIYLGTEWVGRTVRLARDEALGWIREHRDDGSTPDDRGSPDEDRPR